MSDDVERDTLAAAETAFERVMSGVADQIERMPPDVEPGDVLRWAGDRTTELLAGFAELPLDRLLGLDSPPTEPANDNTPTPTGEPVTVRVAAGATAECRLWVHVLGGVGDGALRFALGPLTGPDGAAWTSSQVIFAPAECALPIAAPWSTVLRFQVLDDALPGAHQGLVVTRGAAAAAVPITVIIT